MKPAPSTTGPARSGRNSAGIWKGVATYLQIVSDFVRKLPRRVISSCRQFVSVRCAVRRERGVLRSRIYCGFRSCRSPRGSIPRRWRMCWARGRFKRRPLEPFALAGHGSGRGAEINGKRQRDMVGGAAHRISAASNIVRIDSGKHSLIERRGMPVTSVTGQTSMGYLVTRSAKRIRAGPICRADQGES